MTFHELRSTPAARLGTVSPSILVHRLVLLRRSFLDCTVSFPAGVTRHPAAADWLRGHKIGVAARGVDDLRTTAAMRISPSQVTVHLTARGSEVPVALEVGVRRFVIDSDEHLAALAARNGPRTQVVVDHKAGPEVLMHVLAGRRRVELVGLQVRAERDGTDPLGVQAIREAIRDMALMRRTQGVLLTRVLLDGLDLRSWCDNSRVLRHVGEALLAAVGEACEHHRFPRPQLCLTPDEGSLTSPMSTR